MCFAGAVVACWSLAQDVAVKQVGVLLLKSNIFVTEFIEFTENT